MNPVPSILSIALAALLSVPLQASEFTYSGQLHEHGLPAEGLYDIRITPYSAATSGFSVASPIELRDVHVAEGRFAARLPDGLLADALDHVWLQVELRSEGEPVWSPLPDRHLAELKGTICPAGWALEGNTGTDPSTQYLGTSDNVPLTIRVNNRNVMRFEDRSSPVIIGGHPGNAVIGATVNGAVVAGGGAFNQPNLVSQSFSAILGGRFHTANGENASIVGGYRNTVSGNGAAVGGGWSNTASGFRSTVAGGNLNCAGGDESWAGGTRAKVRPGSTSGEPGQGCEGVTLNGSDGDAGTFVWADESLASFVSSGPGQFLVRASGGALFTNGAVNSPEGNRLRVNGTLRVDTLGSAGATTLCRNASNQIASCSSSARYKSDIVDLELGLDTIARLRPVAYTWTESGKADVGFVAEEVAAVDPRLVSRNAEGEIEGVKYERLGALLANAVREMAQTQDEQAGELSELRQANAQLRAELAGIRETQGQILAALEAIGRSPAIDSLTKLDDRRQ